MTHKTGTPLDPARTSDVAAIQALLAESRAAWNRGDGAAYGRCFTADATDVTYVGTVYRGGQEIGGAHGALFAGFLKGTELTLDITDLRFYGPDTAVVVTRGDVGKGRPRRLGKVATYTVVREPGTGWRIAAVQKTRHKRLMEAVSFRLQPATRPATRFD
ncbi:SgcJ/EcaC family oxidoreductase [Streptomyces sp. NPDC049627]|uniref:SgcJ/EcaC family oxidoreductase n=1 Tax=Streptomyces sp. NPDC049627 TaxID=3365595 RepID=UPI00378FA642